MANTWTAKYWLGAGADLPAVYRSRRALDPLSLDSRDRALSIDSTSLAGWRRRDSTSVSPLVLR